MQPEPDPLFVSFEGKLEAVPPGTPASPRPPHRPRNGSIPATASDGILVNFQHKSLPLSADAPAPAAPRAAEQPVAGGTEEAFAHELAERVLEYVRTHPVGLSAEQLAVLVQRLVARRCE